jgi:putative modified peptide
MTSAEQDRLVRRLSADPAFRAEMKSDMQQALRQAGFDLSEEDLATLRSIDWDQPAAEIAAGQLPLGKVDKIW